MTTNITQTNITETDLEFYESSKFSTEFDNDREPDESELKVLEMSEKYLPESSFSIFKCPICKQRHDMFKLKSNGSSFICSQTGRVI